MARSPWDDQASSNQEYRLLEHIDRLARHREGRKAVQIHLSKLQPHHHREHHIRIAFSTFEDRVKVLDGQLFQVENKDIFFIFQQATPLEVDNAIKHLRVLFTEDPLAHDADGEFCTWYDFTRHYDQLHSVVEAMHNEVQKRNKRLADISQVTAKPPITPHRLGELVESIARADLSNVMRRQSIFAILGGQAPQQILRELFISIGDLQKLILPDYDILADRWLFQALTETLDKRMLAMLMKNDDADIADSFSLNLNVSTLLSPEFLAFDRSLRATVRGSIVIELQLMDIFADISAYTFARDFAHDRGYRVCLDGLTAFTLPFVDREKLGLDLVKLRWDREMMIGDTSGLADKMRAEVSRIGRPRVILCRVDTKGPSPSAFRPASPCIKAAISTS